MITSESLIHSERGEIHENDVSLDLTPLIDIVFIVIVFLLMTTAVPLVKLRVDIPAANENPSAKPLIEKTLVVTIPANNSLLGWRLNEELISGWSEVKHSLLQVISEAEKSNTDLHVSVASDREASAEDLIRIMSFLNENNVDNVQILMSLNDG